MFTETGQATDFYLAELLTEFAQLNESGGFHYQMKKVPQPNKTMDNPLNLDEKD